MCKYSLILCFLLAFSCVREQGSPAPAQPVEGRWPCFNGRVIVLQGGRYGLMKESGEEVLPPRYEAIEFLDNEVALLRREGRFFLSDRNGRILAQGSREDSLRLAWPAIAEEALEADRLSWEQVIQEYERLCRDCKAARGKRISRREYARLRALRQEVEERLRCATGSPSASQKARLEALSADYRRAF